VSGDGSEVRDRCRSLAPLTPQIMKPIEQVAHEMWRSSVITRWSPGRRTAVHDPVGIPTYGVWDFYRSDGGHIHGLNEAGAN